jgi:hypothetical protein
VMAITMNLMQTRSPMILRSQLDFRAEGLRP